jgi:hypothetical protein
VDEDQVGDPVGRTFFLGMRVSSDGQPDERPGDEWSGVVYDQMVPEVSTRFRGLAKLPESVLDVISRLIRGDRGRFPAPPAAANPHRPSTPPSPEDDDA